MYSRTLPFQFSLVHGRHPDRTHTHTHTHTFNGPFSETTRVSRYQKGKTNLDFTEARDSQWQWHQLGQSQSCSRQITMPVPHHSRVFYRPDALPAANQQRQSTEGIRMIRTEAKRKIRNESVLIQLAQCWYPGLAISKAKI